MKSKFHILMENVCFLLRIQNPEKNSIDTFRKKRDQGILWQNFKKTVTLPVEEKWRRVPTFQILFVSLSEKSDTSSPKCIEGGGTDLGQSPNFFDRFIKWNELRIRHFFSLTLRMIQIYHQGSFNCSSLPAGLGGNGEFKRKFEEIGKLRNFERK